MAAKVRLCTRVSTATAGTNHVHDRVMPPPPSSPPFEVGILFSTCGTRYSGTACNLCEARGGADVLNISRHNLMWGEGMTNIFKRWMCFFWFHHTVAEGRQEGQGGRCLITVHHLSRDNSRFLRVSDRRLPRGVPITKTGQRYTQSRHGRLMKIKKTVVQCRKHKTNGKKKQFDVRL